MPAEPVRAAARVSAVLTSLLLLLVSPAHALRLIDYNILNYPGSTGPTRDPFYRTILAPLSPDIVITEEIGTSQGIDEFVANLNVMEPGQWAAAPFSDGNDTEAGAFYKPSKVDYLGQTAFYPNAASHLRLVHVYFFRPVGYTSNDAIIHLYAVHLKASSGTTNENQRFAEAAGIRDSMNALPFGTHAAMLGDCNFYSGLEPALTRFVENEPDNDGRLYDPLGLNGVSPWEDNVTMQIAWTQSPCKTGDTGCASGAATGGMDDRFDLILPTYAFQDGHGLELVPGSYVSVGNDGLHHNNSIQDPPTIPEGAAYATALHSVSDHLPVRVDLRLPAILSVDGSAIAFGTVITGASATHSLTVANPALVPGELLQYVYGAPAGFTAPGGTLSRAAQASADDVIGLDTTTPNNYSGSISITSNALDNPNRSIDVSGTVLRHAVPSLDSLVATLADTLDFGVQDSANFVPLEFRVHDMGFDALQAQLLLLSGTITGGDGHFSLVGGFSPLQIGGEGHSYEVAFDPTGATPDSAYEATLTITSSDEALPGATPRPDLVVTLRAQKNAGSGTTAVQEAPPTVTRLIAPYPNPLRGASTMRYDIARAGEVKLEVFDVTGRRTATLASGPEQPGRYAIHWSGRTDDGGLAHAGLYFVRLIAPGVHPQTARLAIVR
jgi:hypothetical protein